MMKLPKEFKKEFGKYCIAYFFILNVAVFITPLIDNKIIDAETTCIIVGLSVVLIVIALYFMRDPKPLPGKWKRIRVKKDTTIHVEEE